MTRMVYCMAQKKLTVTLKKLWRNEYFQTAVSIGLIVLAVFGFWYGSQAILNTPYPALAVVSGSMCIPYDGTCDGWTHPFSQTLHIGDLIIIQGVNPAQLNANYPDSDITVFHDPTDPTEFIVHRIISKQEINGTLYFRTKGDGNGNVWPSTPEHGMDDWSGYPNGVPQSLVVGKVVMRIPWVGHIVLFMRNSFGIPLVIIIILLALIVEFVIPLVRQKIKNNNNIYAENIKSQFYVQKYLMFL
jgi:signal peptidase I